MSDERESAPGDLVAATNYRSELASASARVEQLEVELRARGGPRKKKRRLFWFLMGGLTALASVGAVSLRDLRRDRHVDEYPPPPATESHAVFVPQPSLGGAQWYTPPGGDSRGPLLVDVNGDGVEDVVGLAWSTHDDEHALHAVAFDGKAYGMLWHSDAFSSQWSGYQTRLLRDGDSLVVSDSRSGLHVLELATGKTRKNITASFDVGGICAASDGGVLVIDAHGSEARSAIDLGTLTLAAAKKGAGCARPAAPADRIATTSTPPSSDREKKNFLVDDARRSGDGVASLGVTETRKGATWDPWIIGWNRTSNAIVYEVSPFADGDARARRGSDTRVVEGGRVYTAYVSEATGKVRIVGRDLVPIVECGI